MATPRARASDRTPQDDASASKGSLQALSSARLSRDAASKCLPQWACNENTSRNECKRSKLPERSAHASAG
eukprot:12685387-Alexandrium_andersonii.AAC.1